MTETTKHLSHVATLTPDEAAEALERFAAAIRRGKLRLSVEGVDVLLRPTRSVRAELHIRGASAAAGGRLDLDLRWTRLSPEPHPEPRVEPPEAAADKP